MNKNRLYIDFHVLQTVPPSCVNRDDTESPKTAVYGGVNRARVSSQAWKRAMRILFEEDLLDPAQVGKRTKNVVEMVAEEIALLNPALNCAKLAEKALKSAGVDIGPEKESGAVKAKALFFMSRDQAKALAKLAAEDEKDTKAYKAAVLVAPSVDMVLFGRMVASDASLNYDAAAQVAHAISTHAVQTEYDYFTAVDDLSPKENAGAGHLGTIEFNSSTLYRYATVNAMELAAHMNPEEAAAAVRTFAEAFIRSMPTGKQNSFANRTLPDAVYVAVRRDQPVNLCGAFERAVRPEDGSGCVAPSKKQLTAYAQQMYRDYTGDPVQAFVIGTGLDALAPAMGLNALLEQLADAVKTQLSGSEVE